MTQHSIARVYGVMQELQQMREKTRKLLENNVELVKALTAAKQELTRARAAQNAVFTNKVLKWMEARYKPVQVHHQAIQCSFEELDQTHGLTNPFEKNEQLEPDPPVSPCRSSSQMHTFLKLRPNSMSFDNDRVRNTIDQSTEDNEIKVESEAKDNGIIYEQVTRCRHSFAQDVDMSWLDDEAMQRQHVYPPLDNLKLRNSQASVRKRLRQRNASVSYVEPKLNTKLRRGDYYGLGQREKQTKHACCIVKHSKVLAPRRANAAFVSSPFGQQFSPFRSRRTGRPIQRISYAEPKLNTKLRQGDKFTFTT